jgi:hypothetical protein
MVIDQLDADFNEFIITDCFIALKDSVDQSA